MFQSTRPVVLYLAPRHDSICAPIHASELLAGNAIANHLGFGQTLADKSYTLELTCSHLGLLWNLVGEITTCTTSLRHLGQASKVGVLEPRWSIRIVRVTSGLILHIILNSISEPNAQVIILFSNVDFFVAECV